MNTQKPCPDWIELLAAPAEDLSPSDRVALDEHLQGCQACRDARESYDMLITRIRAAVMSEASQHFTPQLADLRARIMVPQEEREVFSDSRHRRETAYRVAHASRFSRVTRGFSVCLFIASVLLVSFLLFHHPHTTLVGSGHSPATAVPNLTATAHAITPQSVYNQAISIGSASGQQLHASAYFGQLESVMQRLGSVPFNVDPNFRQAHPALCVETVVVTNVPGNTAVVYALGLGAGWGAAEGVPDPRVAGADRNVHQQLVIPPSNTNSGTQWQAGATVQGAGFDLKTSTYTLKLEDQIGSTAHWFVGGQGSVECTMS